MLDALVVSKNNSLLIIELLFFIWYNKNYCTKGVFGIS